MIFNTDEEAQARCAYWQKILRLQDWHIDTKIKRRSEMPGANACGNIRVYQDGRYAILRLLHPQDFQPGDADDCVDMDDTLVHELLHIYMEAILSVEKLENTDPKYIAIEVAISGIAGGLVKLARSCITPL